MKIGDYIKLKRNELGMTQESLAKKIGVSKSAISRYESNDISNMGIDKAQAMSKALQIDPLTLLTGEIEEEKTITFKSLYGQIRKEFENTKHLKAGEAYELYQENKLPKEVIEIMNNSQRAFTF